MTFGWDLWPELLLEFEDENGNTIEEDEEEEDYTVDDEETTDDTETPTEEEPTTDEPVEGEEEYSMDDVETIDEPTTDEPTTEEPVEGEEEYSMDDEGDDTTEETPTDEEPTTDEPAEGEEDYEIPDDDAGGDLGGDDDYSMDDTEGGDDTSGTDDMSSDNTSTLSNEPASDEASQKLRDLESVVFDTLSDAEKRLKIKELKELYTSIYKKCDVVYNSLTDIRRDEETIQIIEYISNTLIDLKRYVGDYIINLFDVKTYVENLAQLQKYIMIFTAINQVFEQIRVENTK